MNEFVGTTSSRGRSFGEYMLVWDFDKFVNYFVYKTLIKLADYAFARVRPILNILTCY